MLSAIKSIKNLGPNWIFLGTCASFFLFAVESFILLKSGPLLFQVINSSWSWILYWQAWYATTLFLCHGFIFVYVSLSLMVFRNHVKKLSA